MSAVPTQDDEDEECPNDEHRAQNTCAYCVGSGIVDDYEGERPCGGCNGRGHTVCP